MWADFMLVALDPLFNQAANIRYITDGRAGAPFVMRTQQGVTPGSCAQHSQSLEALLAHIPGLRVAVPATPQDAYTLLRTAASLHDPCVVIESRALYSKSGPVTLDGRPEPAGRARLHRSGSDAAIVTWGAMLHEALAAADLLMGAGINVSVLDLRWLAPLDEATLFETVLAASGRVLIVHEANLTGGFGAEVLARLYAHLPGKRLTAARLGTPDTRIPAAPNLQRELIPNAPRIVAALRELLETGTTTDMRLPA
jgi:2-oxoisovalerate dehydrogenase E1 component